MYRNGGDKVEDAVFQELQVVRYGWSKGYQQQERQEYKADLLGKNKYMKEFEFNPEDYRQIRMHFRDMALMIVWRIN